MLAIYDLKKKRIKVITDFFKKETNDWLTETKVKRILNEYENKIPFEIKSEEKWAKKIKKEVIGFSNALNWMIERFESNEDDLTIEEIIEINKRIGYKQFSNKSTMRSHCVEITETDYVTDEPDHEKNKKMYNKFLKNKNSVVKTVNFYLDFIYEQFFNNGNKRTALIIMNYYLMKYHNAYCFSFDTDIYYELIHDFFQKRKTGNENMFLFIIRSIDFF